jgi:energy-coupling factor transport system permease protein
MDPRMKIFLILAEMILAFLAKNFITLAVITLQVFIVIKSSQIAIKTYFRSIKAVLFFILFTTILNIFYSEGEPIFSFWALKITQEGINNSVFTTLLLINLLLISSALTFTTSPTDLTDGLEKLMTPLKYIRVPVHEIALIITIALRFIPTLIDEMDKIIMAQKSRGADFENGNLAKRVRALVPILTPLFVSSIRRAFELATAMECRCYKGGDQRTRMKTLHLKPIDIFAAFFVLGFYSAAIYFNMAFPVVPR